MNEQINIENKKGDVMKRILGITMGILLAGLLAGGVVIAQQGYGHGGYGGYGQGGWHCPWMGSGMGPHHMMGPMHGQNHQQMMQQYGMPPGINMQPNQLLTREQARTLIERYAIGNNANLKIGDLIDKGDVFEATIQDQGGNIVKRLLINRRNGWFRYIP